MTHEELANYFDFLDLHGYKRMHEYHYLEESASMRTVCRYFINHYSMLIPKGEVDKPDIIPTAWYTHVRTDVDASTRKKAVMTAFDKWKAWETETKRLYEDMYVEACDIKEIAAALKIKQLICDVDQELKYVERKCVELKAVDYNAEYIYQEQDYLHKEYEEKCKNIGVSIC
jgi:hypothetical protein